MKAEEFYFDAPAEPQDSNDSIWDHKTTFRHIMKIPKEHYYGTMGLELTAQPVGNEFSEGCYRR